MTETETTSTVSARSPAVAERLEVARSAGRWMPWAGFGCALVWWIGVGGIALAMMGMSALSQLPLSLILGAGFAASLPGFMMLMAGFMARESTRSASANALVMEAASRLLAPAEEAGREATTFADQMRESTIAVGISLNNALGAMRALSTELGDERQRVESVAYASADNARELADRLASERQALETLARDIRAQTTEMTDAIPRQAQLMVEAAKAAGEEVAMADDALEARLKTMDAAGKALAEKLTDLDTLASDAASRSETMTYAVTRLEEKLEASRKTVDAAVRAGEMAAAAAGSTGDALKDAVSAALDGAREASAEINALTRKASEEAAHSMAGLRDTSQEAATAIRVAGMAARAEVDISRPRLAADDSHQHDMQAEIRPQPQTTPPPMATKPQRRSTDADPDTPRRRADDAELFEADRQTNGHAIPNDSLNGEAEPFVLRRRADESEPAPATTPPPNPAPRRNGHAPNGEANGQNGDTAWRDILADIDHDDAAGSARPMPELDREGTAQELIDRLQGSGIQLAEVFRPKAKKRIAIASQKNDHDRRDAIRTSAMRPVERVAARLKGNPDLMYLARNFVVQEEDDALKALQDTMKSGKNASSRLSAYLLIDAALGLTPSY